MGLFINVAATIEMISPINFGIPNKNPFLKPKKAKRSTIKTNATSKIIG
jgi:hypothetical protein